MMWVAIEGCRHLAVCGVSLDMFKLKGAVVIGGVALEFVRPDFRGMTTA